MNVPYRLSFLRFKIGKGTVKKSNPYYYYHAQIHIGRYIDRISFLLTHSPILAVASIYIQITYPEVFFSGQQEEGGIHASRYEGERVRSNSFSLSLSDGMLPFNPKFTRYGLYRIAQFMDSL
jgi:hypothetical protein